MIDMFNLYAEKDILSNILIDDSNFPKCIDVINEFDFYDKKHKILFSKMKEIYAEGKRINEINLTEAIGKKDVLEIGGVNYISSLQAYGSVAEKSYNVDLKSCLRLVKGYSEKRYLKNLLCRAVNAIENGELSNDVIKEGIYKGLSKSFKSNDKTLSPEEYLFKGLEEIEKRYVHGGDIQGMRTGYKSLDENLNGLKKGELVIVAGRPSMGKTVFALNLLDRLSDNNYKVLLHELEMGEETISMRLFSSRLNIENKLLQSGKLSEEQFMNLIDEYQKLIKRGNAFIDFGSKQSLLSISAKAKTMKQTKGLDVLIIDYLGLMDIDLKDTRTNAVGEITRGLKLLAKELNISIVLLCQLSRAVEGRIDKRPMLSDLRDSGNIEQDADVVIFTYREKYYDKKLKEDKLELIVGKNRNGKTGTIKLDFYPEYQKIA